MKSGMKPVDIHSVSLALGGCEQGSAHKQGPDAPEPDSNRGLGAWLSASVMSAAVMSGALMVFASSNSVAAVADALQRPAQMTSLGAHSVLLDAADAGDRLVAVGERGLILLSDDQGKQWRQVPVPVSVTLTGVAFADDRQGFVIGHAGTVLSTDDAGEHWQVRLDGRRIADLVLVAARQSADDLALRSAERLVEDGPDKPLLDLLVLGQGHVLVVGAYGIALETRDGGASWTSRMDSLENDMGMHLYALARSGNRILVGGEQGLARFSRDAGQSFETLDVPYEGSFFSAELIGDSGIVLSGMRGNVWRSHDNGQSWRQIPVPVSSSITDSSLTRDGHLLMVNQAGMVLEERAGALVPISSVSFPPLNNVLPTRDGGLLLLGVQGLISVAAGDLK
jgi:photosystem II stability/assembly factor-like uncharacterized protein